MAKEKENTILTDSPQVKKGNLQATQQLFGECLTIIRNTKGNELTGKEFILRPKEGEVYGLYSLLRNILKTFPDKTLLNKLGERIDIKSIK